MEPFSTDGPEPIAFHTRDRRPVTLRRVRPGDTALLVDLLGRLSARTWRLRYFTARPSASEAAWREAGRMARGHAAGHLTLVALARPGGRDEAVAVAELVRDAATPAIGDLAVLVRDDYQANGVGLALGRRLLDNARAAGVTTVRAELFAENRGALRLLRRLGVAQAMTLDDGELSVLAEIPRERGEARGATRGDMPRTDAA